MTDWKKRAREARTKLRHTKHGEREAMLRQMGGDNDPNTVRRAIFALAYLDEVKQSNPSVWKSLEHSSLSLVELLARWNSFDAGGAIKAAREVAAGRYTVIELKKAMQKARLDIAAKSESLPYRDRIRASARKAVEDILGGNISLPEVGFKISDDPPLDFRYLRTHGQPPSFETVAGLIVGPYQNLTLYRKRRQDWLFRAFGLAWLYNHVVLFLPDPTEVNSYRAWIRDAQARAKQLDPSVTSGLGRGREPSVHVIHPKLEGPPDLTDEQAASLRSIGG